VSLLHDDVKLCFSSEWVSGLGKRCETAAGFIEGCAVGAVLDEALLKWDCKIKEKQYLLQCGKMFNILCNIIHGMIKNE